MLTVTTILTKTVIPLQFSFPLVKPGCHHFSSGYLLKYLVIALKQKSRVGRINNFVGGINICQACLWRYKQIIK